MMPGVHMLNTQRFIQGLRGTLNSSNASCSSLPIFPPRAIYAESVSPPQESDHLRDGKHSLFPAGGSLPSVRDTHLQREP